MYPRPGPRGTLAGVRGRWDLAGSGRRSDPRPLWRAPEYATATVGRIGDGRVSVALRRRRHHLLNGVTVGTRIDPDFPPGFRLHASKSHGFIVHWALWRLLRGCHVTPLLPLQFCRCHQGAFQRGTRDYQNRVARFIEPGGWARSEAAYPRSDSGSRTASYGRPLGAYCTGSDRRPRTAALEASRISPIRCS